MHEVETMMYAGAQPWHGLGTKVEGPALHDWRATMKLAGLDWTVRPEELIVKSDGRPVTHVANVRSTDDAILGVVGPSYEILQNEQAFEWFQPFLETGECTFEAAGSLRFGSRIWALAKIEHADGIVRDDDKVVRYVLLSHAHDGSLAVRVGFTDTRVVCMNTLRAAHTSEGSQLIRIKHTTNVVANLKAIRETMDTVRAGFFSTLEQYRKLADKAINRKDVRRYVELVMDVDPQAELATRTKNTIDAIVRNAFKGVGNNGSTMWDAYNGVTQYTTWERGRNQDTRLQSLWYGDSAKLNEKALALALDFAA